MGNPIKPMELRQLQGSANRNKQRQNKNVPDVVRGIGPAPEYFNELQSETWDYLVTIMFSGVLAESDRPTFEVLTVLFYRFRHGEYGEKAVIPALAVGELARMDSIMSRYGMTPSDRNRIVVKGGEKKNPFGEI